jgi:hypothetical protein
MLLILAALTLTGLLLSAYLASKVADQEKRIRVLESSRGQGAAYPLEAGEPYQPVLEGLKVAIQIQQDHERPVFALLLKERLVAEDAVPILGSMGEEVACDVLVKGKVKCNGYEELFYEATLDCLAGNSLLLTVSEKPSQGGRQANLSNTLVSRLKHELQQSAERRERQLALDQLGA